MKQLLEAEAFAAQGLDGAKPGKVWPTAQCGPVLLADVAHRDPSPPLPLPTATMSTPTHRCGSSE